MGWISKLVALAIIVYLLASVMSYRSELDRMTELASKYEYEMKLKSVENVRLLNVSEALENELKEAKRRYNDEIGKLRMLNERLNEAERKVSEYERGYIRKFVSKDEVMSFLNRDDTNNFEWTEDFDCTQFANRLVKNALEEGILACVVEIDFPDAAHDIVAFSTDEGILYVEPQTDEIVHPVVGEPYWDRSLYEEPDYNDTIVRYTSCFGMNR